MGKEPEDKESKKSVKTPKVERQADKKPEKKPESKGLSKISLPSLAATSRTADLREDEVSCRKRTCKYLYNKEKKTFCERTCKNWASIIAYAIMYMIFLSTYTMIFLFGSLSIIKLTTNFDEKPNLLTYSENGIGLTAVPTSEGTLPLIWYKNGETDGQTKYISALDRLFKSNRRKNDNVTEILGPCAVAPYGYGDKPCIVVKINKQLKWSGKPLDPKSPKAANAPTSVKKWMERDKKLWLHCEGSHSYDREHIGNIKYYPDPPGFDPDLYPLDMQSQSPLVAVQITDFTLGVSLAIECKLWYDMGPSSVAFILYVAPQVRIR